MLGRAEQRREARRAVEPGHAPPVDRPVARRRARRCGNRRAGRSPRARGARSRRDATGCRGTRHVTRLRSSSSCRCRDADLIGVDVGGSGIKAALRRPRRPGTPTGRIRVATPQPATPDAVAATIAEARRPARRRRPDRLHAARGRRRRHRAHRGAHRRGVDRHRTRQRCSADATGRPCAVLNDADAAGLAEARFGAARDEPRRRRRWSRSAPASAPRCSTTASSSRTPSSGTSRSTARSPTRGRPTRRATSKHLVVEAVGASASTRYLTQLHAVLWPELIVIGGGVVKHADKFLDRLDPGCEVRVAELGNLAGIVGAALAASGAAACDAGLTRRRRVRDRGDLARRRHAAPSGRQAWPGPRKRCWPAGPSLPAT